MQIWLIRSNLVDSIAYLVSGKYFCYLAHYSLYQIKSFDKYTVIGQSNYLNVCIYHSFSSVLMHVSTYSYSINSYAINSTACSIAHYRFTGFFALLSKTTLGTYSSCGRPYC